MWPSRSSASVWAARSFSPLTVGNFDVAYCRASSVSRTYTFQSPDGGEFRCGPASGAAARCNCCFSPLTVGNFDVACLGTVPAVPLPGFSPLTVGNFDVATTCRCWTTARSSFQSPDGGEFRCGGNVPTDGEKYYDRFSPLTVGNFDVASHLCDPLRSPLVSVP